MINKKKVNLTMMRSLHTIINTKIPAPQELVQKKIE